MLHLLTDEYRDKIRNDYLDRLAALSLWLLCFVGCVGVVSLIPAYTLIHFEKEDVSKKIIEKGEGVSTSTDTLTLKSFENSIDENISYLSSSRNVLEKIDAINALKSSDIIISLINIEGTTLTVGGTSKTRLALSDFEKKVRAEKWVKDVSLPLQVFAQEKNISFNALITLSDDSK